MNGSDTEVSDHRMLNDIYPNIVYEFNVNSVQLCDNDEGQSASTLSYLYGRVGIDDDVGRGVRGARFDSSAVPCCQLSLTRG